MWTHVLDQIKNMSSPCLILRSRHVGKKEYKYGLSSNDSSPKDCFWHLVTCGPWTSRVKDGIFVINVHQLSFLYHDV